MSKAHAVAVATEFTPEQLPKQGAILPLDLLDPSPSNPRKVFDELKLAELAASIKEHGLAQPVLVRPHPTDPGRYQLVVGERRLRAVRLLGYGAIPAIVRELDDGQVLELQVIENNQREDVHPLEEADGFAALHAPPFNRTVEDLVAKTGKSKAYVYARLKLCALAGDAREAFVRGDLTPSTALLVARMPVALQAKATKEITTPMYGGEPMSHRAAARHLESRYFLRLADAPFPTKDASLVKAAGSCSACPKRTGNQAELFADITDADVCTDPDCFAVKKEAGWQRRVKEAEKAGIKVLTEEEVKKEMPYGSVAYGGAYVDLDSYSRDDEQNRTHREIIGEEVGRKLVLARDAQGRVHELVPRRVAEVLLVKAGVEIQSDDEDGDEGRPAGPRSSPEHERYQRENSARKLLYGRVRDATIAAVEQRPADDAAVFELILRGQLAIDDFGVRNVFDRRGIEIPEDLEDDTDDALVKLARAGRTAAEFRGLVVEVCCTDIGLDALEQLGLVDPVALRAAVEKETGVDFTPPKPDTPPAAADGVKLEDLEIGVCRICRCIAVDACKPTCAWADDTETLCTSCVGHEKETEAETWGRLFREQGFSFNHIATRFETTIPAVEAVIAPPAPATKKPRKKSASGAA